MIRRSPRVRSGSASACALTVGSPAALLYAAEALERRTLLAVSAVTGAPVSPAASAVVNFADLARQQPPPAPEAGDQPSAAPAPGANLASPAPSANFAAANRLGTFETVVPGTMGAVGDDKLFVTLNSSYRVQNKADGALLGSPVPINNFWAPLGASNPFYSRTAYDPYNDRWLVSATSDFGTANSSILVAVSQTSDPQGAFSLYRFDVDGSNAIFADVGMLGFNKNWLVISANTFTISSQTFAGGRMLVLDYPALRAGTVTGTFLGPIAETSGGEWIHPAATYSSSESTLYVVSHTDDVTAGYRLSTLTGTPAAPVLTIGPERTRPGGGWRSPTVSEILPQSGAGRIASDNSYIRSDVVFRNGGIYYAQTVLLGALVSNEHTAAQWTQLNTAGDVVQGGRIEDPTATATNGGRWYAYPSIAVNSQNDVMVGFSEFESDDFVDAGYAVRYAADPAGTMRDPVIFKEGQAVFDFGAAGNTRWGDYSQTVVDPADGLTLWTIQEYAAAPAVQTWGTWWAKVAVATPPTVTGVFVDSTLWTTGFRSAIQAAGQGSSELGFFIGAGLAQFDELPWTNLDRVSVRFSKDVSVQQADLIIRGANVATYAFSAFVYDPDTLIATWTLADGGDAGTAPDPFAAEKVRIVLDGTTANGVVDGSGFALDGEWLPDGTDAYPSGNGTPGGDFSFRLNVLPGDVNRSGGSVVGSDVTLVRNAQNSTPGAVGSLYTVFKDVNGSASILGSDVTLVRNRQGTSLPAGEPAAPTGGFVAVRSLVRSEKRLTDGLV